MPVAPSLRDLIDAALHAVMEEAAAEAKLSAGTLGRCGDYAIVGARVLSKLLGHPYVAVAGGEIIDCGGGMYVVLFPSRKARRHARKLSDLKDYHCWIQSVHMSSEGVARLESIDFTVRHNRAVADLLGVPFTLSDEAYLWDWLDQIPLVLTPVRPQLSANGNGGDWMWRDDVCMRLLRKYAHEHDALLNTLVARVFKRLADLIEASANANLGTSPNASLPLCANSLLCVRTVRQGADSAILRSADRPA